MTFAELIVAVFLLVCVYYLLKPFQKRIEYLILRSMDRTRPHVIDVSVIRDDKENRFPKE